MCYYRDRSRKYPSVPRNGFIQAPGPFLRAIQAATTCSMVSGWTVGVCLPPRENRCQNWRIIRLGNKQATQARTGTMAFATSPATVLNPWLQILAALEKKVIHQSFETWLKPTRYSHAAGRTLYVRVPSPEFQHIGDKYGDLIQEAIDLQSLEFDDVCFVTAEEDPSIPPQRKDGGFGPVASHAPTAPASPAPRAPAQLQIDWSTAAQLNSRYTFDNFVIGNGNQFARAAAMAVAERPSRAYNPLRSEEHT